jgi:hypothetical protein
MPANPERCLDESSKSRRHPSDRLAADVSNALHDLERDPGHLEPSPSRIQGTIDAINRLGLHALNDEIENSRCGQPQGRIERKKPSGFKDDGMLRGCIIWSVLPDKRRNLTNEATGRSLLRREGLWVGREVDQTSKNLSERSHSSRVLHFSLASFHHLDGVQSLVSWKSNERSHSARNCPQTVILAQHRACMGNALEWKLYERSHPPGSMGASKHGIMDRTDRLTSKHESRSRALWHPHGRHPVSLDHPAACPLSVQSPRSFAWSHASGSLPALPYENRHRRAGEGAFDASFNLRPGI